MGGLQHQLHNRNAGQQLWRWPICASKQGVLPATAPNHTNHVTKLQNTMQLVMLDQDLGWVMVNKPVHLHVCTSTNHMTPTHSTHIHDNHSQQQPITRCSAHHGWQ